MHKILAREAKLWFIGSMTYIKSLTSAIILATLSLPAFAGETPSTVVELFTSQGCSSCPSANAFVGGLTDDADKLVLTYGVTYWDYLGWKDTFGNARNTDRQREYGQAFGIGNVYTPQIVLNGSAHSPRYKKSDINTMPLQTKGDVDIDVIDGQVIVTGAADQSVLITYKPGWQSVEVSKGENHGRTLRLANVVTHVQPLSMDAPLDVSAKEGLAYAVLVHDPTTKKITNAAVYAP